MIRESEGMLRKYFVYTIARVEEEWENCQKILNKFIRVSRVSSWIDFVYVRRVRWWFLINLLHRSAFFHFTFPFVAHLLPSISHIRPHVRVSSRFIFDDSIRASSKNNYSQERKRKIGKGERWIRVWKIIKNKQRVSEWISSEREKQLWAVKWIENKTENSK